jgi:hypothetical protein
VTSSPPPDRPGAEEPAERLDELAERLDEPSVPVGPEPSGRTGATLSERATAQTVRDLSEPERLDGSRGTA